MIEIKKEPTGDILLRIEAETLAGADLREKNLRGASLRNMDLSRADLTGASLRGANLTGSNLEEAKLLKAGLLLAQMREANLRKADLRGANLEGTDLTKADLRGANLSDARLFGTPMPGAVYDQATVWPAGFDPEKCGAKRVASDAPMPDGDETEARISCPHCAKEIPADAVKCRHCGKWLKKPTEKDEQGLRILGSGGEVLLKVKAETLQGVNLSNADLHGANLINGNLRGANLKGMDLSRAALAGANLEGAILSHANLSGANLRDANLACANMDSASMRGTGLERAILIQANLTGANLREANLSEADLRGAIFLGANLYSVILKDAIYDENTRWPLDFRVGQSGAQALTTDEQAGDGAEIEKIKCPFCAEEVLADAVKCRFCGEWLVEFEESGSKLKLIFILAAVAAVLAVGGYFAYFALLSPPPIPAQVAIAVSPTPALAAEVNSADVAPAGQPRLIFPSEISIGFVKARGFGLTDEGSWKRVGDARGVLPIPAGREIRLDINDTTADLTPLEKIGSFDLHTLDLTLAPIKDQDLAHLKWLTGLQELYLPRQITDRGLAYLEPLKGLITLQLFDTLITDAGTEHIKKLKMLEALYLPKQISDRAIADLQQALPKCVISRQ